MGTKIGLKRKADSILKRHLFETLGSQTAIVNTIQPDEATVPQGAPGKTDVGAMAMVSTLFFAWGFLTCLNDILIPHLKNIFELNYAEVMLVQFAFFSAYFLFSMPSGKIVEWIGYKRSMVTGLLLSLIHI